MSKYRLTKEICKNNTDFWIEKQKKFLFWTWWVKTTFCPHQTEEAAMAHLEDLCEPCIIEHRHLWHKENSL